MKAFILSMLALGGILSIMLLYLSQPSDLDRHIDRMVQEWQERMNAVFKDLDQKGDSQ